METCLKCNLKRADHLMSKTKTHTCVWCTGEPAHLKVRMSFGTHRDYNTCLHLEEGKTVEEGARCLLYHCKKCVDINHRDITQCIYLSKDRFIWGDQDWANVLKKYFELFLGEDVEPIIMEVGKKTIEVPIGKKKQPLTRKEKRKIKLGRGLSDIIH